jgi:hypothetical protein
MVAVVVRKSNAIFENAGRYMSIVNGAIVSKAPRMKIMRARLGFDSVMEYCN